MPHKIIDTNVPLTAAGDNDAATDICQLACVQIVRRVLKGEIVAVIDEGNEALAEYRSNMYPDPNPSAGLASQFLMYLLTHYNMDRVHRVKLETNEDGQYEDYPDKDDEWVNSDRNDKKCKQFDADDKKWVAMAARFKKDTQKDAPIVNAADQCWRVFESVLSAVDIRLESLC